MFETSNRLWLYFFARRGLQASKDGPNWKKLLMIFCISIFISAYGAGCTNSTAVNNDTDSGGDTDVNSDTDIDSDADTDADSDTDTEMDTDTDTDTGTDTNTESTDGGQLLWAKRAGGSEIDHGMSVAALSDGSALVTGYFYDKAIFGPGETNETDLNGDKWDIFVAKYNADGTLAWAKSAGGISSEDEGSSISALSDGSALVTGKFWDAATFGLGETNETVLTPDGNERDVFVAKYNADGTLAWARRAGGNDWDSGHGISAISDNQALMTGSFYGMATFGLGETNETVLTSDGWSDIFVAKIWL